MREVEIVYGDKLIAAQLPEPVLTATAEYGAQKVAAIGDIRQALKEAMAHPMDLPPVREMAGPGMKVTIAFDDPTVPQVETQVYLAEVHELSHAYPEVAERTRKWVSPEEAASMVAEPELQDILREL